MIILASASIARRKLIKICRKNVVVKKPRIDEAMLEGESVFEYLQRITYLKASRFANKKDTVIAADTIIFYKNEVIGKPENKKEAFEIIDNLSGNYHLCFSGVTVSSDNGYKFFIEHAVVYVEKMTQNEIKAYLDKKEYVNRAAGYAIQGTASNFIHVIKGDITTVIGLPMKKLCRII